MSVTAPRNTINDDVLMIWPLHGLGHKQAVHGLPVYYVITFSGIWTLTAYFEGYRISRDNDNLYLVTWLWSVQSECEIA